MFTLHEEGKRMTTSFKTCPSCKTVWASQEKFISDAGLKLNGYKADFEKLEYGLFFFTHTVPSCQSTMVIEVSDFLNLYTGPRYTERKTDTEECPGYCKDKEQLSRCEALCECAFVREICNIIREKQNG
jgi:hypothetical protein